MWHRCVSVEFWPWVALSESSSHADRLVFVTSSLCPGYRSTSSVCCSPRPTRRRKLRSTSMRCRAGSNESASPPNLTSSYNTTFFYCNSSLDHTAFGTRDVATNGISTPPPIVSPVGLNGTGRPHAGLCPKCLVIIVIISLQCVSTVWCWAPCNNHCNFFAASWVKKSTRGIKLQLSDKQLQISNRGHYGCSKFQFCP